MRVLGSQVFGQALMESCVIVVVELLECYIYLKKYNFFLKCHRRHVPGET